MRRLDRYILREILYPSLIGLVALTFVAVSRELGTLLEIIVRQSATPAQIWAISAAILPNVLTFTLPMAVLVGILTGFGRLSSDSETIAIRAAGVSMRRILAPVLVLGVTAWIANMVMTAWIAPEMAVRLNQLKSEILLRQAPLVLEHNVFNEKIPGYTLYIRNVPSHGEVWRDIMVDDMRNPDEEVIVFAASGVPTLNERDQTLQVTLKDGNSHHIHYSTSQHIENETFSERTISIPLPDGASVPATPPLSQATTKLLWQHMREGGASYEERVEFHRRFALPFACIAFVFVGLPLGVSTTRGTKSMGLVLSLVLMFLYYLGFLGGTRLAGDSNFSPFLGAWIPNIVFLLVGLVMMSRADREHENHLLVWVKNATEWFGEKMSSVKRTQQHLTRWIYSFVHRSKLFRVLDRYVLRGFCFYFILVLVVFVSLFIVVTVFELLPDIVRNHSSIATVALYFVFLMPQILFWVVPLTVLLAILISLGTLTKANEVLAVKAAGISLYRLSLPLLFMGLMISGVLYLMQDYVLPTANKRQDEYRDIIKGRAPQSYRNPDRKWMAGSDNRIYHYSYFRYATNLFGNLSIFKFEPGTFNLREWTFAPSGTWDKTSNSWLLQNVRVHRISPTGTQSSFESHTTLSTTDMDNPEYFKDEVRTASQMTSGELKKQIAELQKKQFDVTGLTLDLYRKFSFPLVAFIMALIGIPFSFKTGKKGAFYGIGICIGLGILYWSTFELFDKLGEVNRLSPLIAAWFPNFIFGIGGVWMMLRVKT